jgi:hypothetical protein
MLESENGRASATATIEVEAVTGFFQECIELFVEQRPETCYGYLKRYAKSSDGIAAYYVIPNRSKVSARITPDEVLKDFGPGKYLLSIRNTKGEVPKCSGTFVIVDEPGSEPGATGGGSENGFQNGQQNGQQNEAARMMADAMRSIAEQQSAMMKEMFGYLSNTISEIKQANPAQKSDTGDLERYLGLFKQMGIITGNATGAAQKAIDDALQLANLAKGLVQSPAQVVSGFDITTLKSAIAEVVQGAGGVGAADEDDEEQSLLTQLIKPLAPFLPVLINALTGGLTSGAGQPKQLSPPQRQAYIDAERQYRQAQINRTRASRAASARAQKARPQKARPQKVDARQARTQTPPKPSNDNRNDKKKGKTMNPLLKVDEKIRPAATVILDAMKARKPVPQFAAEVVKVIAPQGKILTEYTTLASALKFSPSFAVGMLREYGFPVDLHLEWTKSAVKQLQATLKKLS